MKRYYCLRNPIIKPGGNVVFKGNLILDLVIINARLTQRFNFTNTHRNWRLHEACGNQLGGESSMME